MYMPYLKGRVTPESVVLGEDTNRVFGQSKMTGVTSNERMTPDGIILPRKPHNPCVESTERQRLHRELLLNQKLGKNVLNQKSELQRAMERHKESVLKKELEQQKAESMTPLERVIEQRAKRLEILERDEKEMLSSSPTNEPEFLQIHAKLKARMMDSAK